MNGLKKQFLNHGGRYILLLRKRSTLLRLPLFNVFIIFTFSSVNILHNNDCFYFLLLGKRRHISLFDDCRVCSFSYIRRLYCKGSLLLNSHFLVYAIPTTICLVTVQLLSYRVNLFRTRLHMTTTNPLYTYYKTITFSFVLYMTYAH